MKYKFLGLMKFVAIFVILSWFILMVVVFCRFLDLLSFCFSNYPIVFSCCFFLLLIFLTIVCFFYFKEEV